MLGDMSTSSCLSVKAVCQGKSPCLDIGPLSPVEQRLIICMETPIYVISYFVCCVLYHGESVENIRNSPFHGRLLSLINVSMRALLGTALLPAPCACAAAARSSIAIFTTAADLNAVCFFLQKKKTLHFLFCFCTKQNFQ